VRTSHRTIAGQGTPRAYLGTGATPPAITRASTTKTWSPAATTSSPALAAAADGGCEVAEVISETDSRRSRGFTRPPPAPLAGDRS